MAFFPLICFLFYPFDFKGQVPISDRRLIPLMHHSYRRFNIPPGIPRAFDAFAVPGGREFDPYTYGVGNLKTITSISCYVSRYGD